MLIDYLRGHPAAAELLERERPTNLPATALRTGTRLLTRNVRHFPMFVELQAPY